MKNNEQKVMLTGVRPSGNLTLGNYLGAIKNFVTRQNQYKSYIFVADLHAITSPRNPAELREAVNDCIAMYLACGINPEQTIIFRQSDVLKHGIMGFIMTFQTHIGELSRMTQFKLKSQNMGKNGIDTGLFVYPPLMSADILLYNTDIVPVGMDQQQHVELTRDLAQRFNKRYGDTLNEPDVYIAPVGNKILNLQNPTEKMNKSDGPNLGTIFLMDDLKLARKKIMSAVTDSESVVRFNEENKPGISNLISILAATTSESIESIEKRFVGRGYGDFKREVADAVCDLIENIQTKYQQFKNSDVLNAILTAGAERARIVASETLNRARVALGLK
ncbi:MAG: tryptophan--tRNA ligase [Alphaproteobacteria bacterium]|nr:tryptophan--tRNA ligase [Alphaproteobacteria bacterium]